MPDSRQETGSTPLLQQLSPGSAGDTAEHRRTQQNGGSPDPRPHILLIVDTFPRSLGGGERVVLRLAALLPRYGFRVSILTFSIDPESSFQPQHSPCPLYLLPLDKAYNLRAWRGAFALRRLIRQQRIQLVQTFFESSDLWGGLVTRLLSSAKLVWSRRDMGILRGRKHAIAYRALRRLPHGVHAVSEQVRRHAVEIDGIPPERTFTVHNGLDLGSFGSVADLIPPEPPVVLTIGNIRRVKGHDVLIRAAALVRDRFPQVRFLLAGEVLESEFNEELVGLIGSLHLGETFRFLGAVTDLPAQLKAASLFVLPSRSEGFSNSLLEAMACALPVIATDVGGNAEAVQPEITGLLVPADDPSAMAEAILRLLSSPSERRRMGQAGRNRVEAEFSADAMLRNLTRAYGRILIGT